MATMRDRLLRLHSLLPRAALHCPRNGHGKGSEYAALAASLLRSSPTSTFARFRSLLSNHCTSRVRPPPLYTSAGAAAAGARWVAPFRVFNFSLQRRGGGGGWTSLLSSFRRSWIGSNSYRMHSQDEILWFLIGSNIAVFFLWRFVDTQFMMNHFMISLDNFKSGRLHTLLTSAFSHTQLDHLFVNMIGLYFFGRNIASLFGPDFLLKLYVAGALSGSVFFLLHRAYLDSKNQRYMGRDNSRFMGLGASAATNAIILLEVFLFPKRLVYLYLVLPVPAALVGALLIGSDLWRIEKAEEHVSGAGHLGGAVVAALVWARVRNRRI